MLADHQLKVRKIAETVGISGISGISKDCVDHILHEILGRRKLSTRCTHRNLETTSGQFLTLFKRNSKEFLRRFVTVDETWIRWYTPETKKQSKQWTSLGERAPKKKTVLSTGRDMATVFWDSQGVIYIYIDYLEKDKTVTGLYYAELLGKFDTELQKNDPI